jgi:hypothetical protein
MRYYIKCELDPQEQQRWLGSSINSGSLARHKIFHEGMHTDENYIVHFVEICY